MFCYYNYSISQGSAGETPSYETRYCVDMPTAGVISKSKFGIYSRVFNGGGIFCSMNAAPFKNFNIGVGFSGSNIIGNGDVVWQSIPSVELRLRIFNENHQIPAILLGVSTQGTGTYSNSQKRFETYSPGVFLALSKNYTYSLGSVAFTGGICYSFESPSKKRTPNFWIGMEHSLGSSLSINLEYNANLDDNNKSYITKRGILNSVLRWSVASGFTVEILARDLLVHKSGAVGFERSLGLEYVASF